MKNKSRAFSLIELSIVILIIGILIAGVTQGSRLLRQAKLSSAQTLTKSSPVAGIPGLVIWFEPTLDESFPSADADDGAPITSWNDINPQTSEKSFLQPSIGTDFTYSANSGPNGLPSIFSAGGDALAASGPIVTPNNKFTFFAVYQTTISSGSSSQILVNNAWQYELSSSNQRKIYLNAMANAVGGTASTNAEVISIVGNGSQASTYVNSLSDIPSSTFPLSTPTSPFTIGEGWNGYISEIIYFDHVLKTEERQSIEEYLEKKYGIKSGSGASASS
jgi:prepilin-type N-terminal cleavage/methylation domain-containing protein